jgi:hypothetical protein
MKVQIQNISEQNMNVKNVNVRNVQIPQRSMFFTKRHETHHCTKLKQYKLLTLTNV